MPQESDGNVQGAIDVAVGGLAETTKEAVLEEVEPMLYEIGTSVANAAAANAAEEADAAQAAAEATAAADATAKADAAEAAAEAYTDAQLASVDLTELAELSAEVKILDDTVVLDPAAADFDLSNVVPSGAVIINAQVKLDTAVTGAGGATKVGLGTAADPDKYGKTASLLIDQAFSTTPNWVPLSGPETIKLYAVDNAGAAAGTIGGEDETVRVRVMYTQANPI